jgi:hypothetical protein
MLVKQAVPGFLPAKKGQFPAVTSLQTASDQELIVRVQEIVAGSRRKAEE